jgi:hypothetical protein
MGCVESTEQRAVPTAVLIDDIVTKSGNPSIAVDSRNGSILVGIRPKIGQGGCQVVSYAPGSSEGKVVIDGIVTKSGNPSIAVDSRNGSILVGIRPRMGQGGCQVVSFAQETM